MLDIIMHITKFARLVREAVKNPTAKNYGKGNRKFHSTAQVIFDKHGYKLDPMWQDFMTMGILNHHLRKDVQDYKSQDIYYSRLVEWLRAYYYEAANCKTCEEPMGKTLGPALGLEPVNIFCCSSCASSNPEVLAKVNSTNQARYGASRPLQAKKIQAKQQKTMKDRHGGFTLASKSLSKKARRTMKVRYGSENISQVDYIRSKAEATYARRHGKLESPDGAAVVDKKRRSTFLNIYGVDSPFKSSDVKEKIRETNIKRYGVGNVMQFKAVRDKALATTILRHGCVSASQTDIVKAKTKATCQARYGVDAPMQNPEFRNKQAKAALQIREIKIGSYTYCVQSKSEEIILRKLLAKHGANGVLTQFSTKFPNEVFAQSHTYPDFYLPKSRVFVEVKSSWTFMGREGNSQRAVTEGNLERNKEKARISNAANKVIWVIQDRGNVAIQLPRSWYTWSDTRIRKYVIARNLRSPRVS